MRQLITTLFIFMLGSGLHLSAQTPLKLNLPDITVNCTDTARVAVTVQNFDSIVSLQFNLNWKPSELKFFSIGQFNPKLGLSVSSNFGPGPNQWQNGTPITFSWFDNSLQGVSLPNNDTLFVVRYLLLDTAGQTTRLFISDTEASNTNGVNLPVNTQDGFVTISDIQKPTISCPTDLTVSTGSATTDSITIIGTQPPVITDNCDPKPVLTYRLSGATGGTGAGSINGKVFRVGLTTVTYRAQDASGNRDSCQFKVTVTKPLVSNTDTFYIQAGNATATCNDTVIIPLTVQNFTDIAALSFNLQWDTARTKYVGVSGFNKKLPVNASDINVIGGRELIFLWANTQGGRDTLPKGDTLFLLRLRTTTARPQPDTVQFKGILDVSGGNPLATLTKVASTNGLITVSDNIPPNLTCPADLTLSVPAGTGNISVSNINAIANDRCGAPQVSFTLAGASSGSGNGNASGSIFNVGQTTVSYRAQDGSGNSSTCSFRVTISATAAPAVFQVSADNKSANCGDTISVPIRVKSFNNIISLQFGLKWPVNALSFIDATNLNSSLPITINELATDPALVSQGRAILSWIGLTGSKTLPDSAVLFTLRFKASGTGMVMFDTAANALTKIEVAGGSPIAPLAYEVRNGTISVNDNTNPTINCPKDITITSDPLTQSGTVNSISPVATDNCGTPAVSYQFSGATTGSGNGDANGKSFTTGTTRVVYTATDGSGNTATCAFNVMAERGISDPIFTLGTATGRCGDTVTVPVTASNFIGITSVQFSTLWNVNELTFAGVTQFNSSLPVDATNFNLAPSNISNGKLPFTWTDAQGVGDTLPPNSVLFGIRFVVTGNGGSNKMVKFDLSPGATPPFEVTKGIPAKAIPFIAFNGMVTVSDTIRPVVVCPSDRILTIFSGLNGSFVNNIAPQATDNCAVDAVRYTFGGATIGSGYDDASGRLFQAGITTVTYTVTDITGNTATCSFRVTINNTIPANRLTLVAQSKEAMCGDDEVAIDITTFRFDTLISLQYTLNWDTNVLRYARIGNLNQTLGLDSIKNFGLIFARNGTLTTSWLSTNATTLPAGARLFTIYFRPVGPYSSSSRVHFDTSATAITPFEASRSPYPTLVGADFYDGNVYIADTIPPRIVCPADKVVKITYSQLNTTVFNISPQATDNCDVDGFTYTLAGATTGSGVNDASGELFNLGTTHVTYTAYDAAGNSASCSFKVTLKQLPSVNFSLIADSKAVNCSDTIVAVDIRTINFDSISSFQFTSKWDPASLGYRDLGNFYPGLNLSSSNFNFNFTNNGLLNVTWIDTSASALFRKNLPDSAILFTIYFKPLTKAGTSSKVGFDTSAAAITPIEVSKGFPAAPIIYDLFEGMIRIIDLVPPTITCPANVRSVNAVVNNIGPNPKDDCEVKSVSYTLAGATTGNGQNDASGTRFNLGTTTVTYTVVDGGGNSATCSFTVTIGPDTMYVSTNSITAACGDTASLYITARNVTNVEDMHLVVRWDSTVAGLVSFVPNAGLSGGDFRASSNKLSYIRSVNTPPLTLANDTFAVIRVKINGSGSSLINFDTIRATSAGLPPQNFVIVLSTGDITVNDTIKPRFTFCPQDLTVYLASGCDSAVTWTAPVVTDNCGTTIVSSNRSPGERLAVGFYAVLYAVADLAGNTETCRFVIEVADTIKPAFTNCPSDLTIALTSGCDTAVTWTAPSATDNCGTPVVNASKNPGDRFGFGLSAVTYTATDSSGNTSTCTFAIRVEDPIPPVFTNCPPQGLVRFAGDTCGNFVTWLEPVASDNCPQGLVVTSTHKSGDYFAVGQSTVVYTATDSAGNTATCSFGVLVLDARGPRLIGCPADTVVRSKDGDCGANVSWVPPVGVDNCDPNVTVTSDSVNGQFFLPGDHFVTFTGRDSSGNINECFFKITVIGGQKPRFVGCPKDTIVYTLANQCGRNVLFNLPSVVGGCGDTSSTLTLSHLPDDFFNLGTTRVEFIATGSNGLKDTCAFTITVLDTIPPVFTNCPVDVTVNAAAGTCAATVNWTPPGVTDNCSSRVVVVASHLPGGSFPAGRTRVSYTATDSLGNVAICAFTITVVESERPVLTNCPSNILVTMNSGKCDTTFALPQVTVKDNCDTSPVITVLYNPANNGTFVIGNNTITVYGKDVSGNTTDTCRFNVVVVDPIAPVFTSCPKDTIIDAIGGCKGVGQWLLPTATDNCDTSVVLTSNFKPGDTLVQTRTTVIYTATDDSGNSSTCSFTVTIRGITPPVIIDCPTDITVGSDTGQCGVIVGWKEPIAQSSCGSNAVTLTTNIKPNSFFPVGRTTVVYVAKDISGDSTICSFNVFVIDNVKPTFSNCPPDTIKTVAVSGCNAIVTWTPPTARDNCANNVVIASNITPPAIFGLGATRVSYIARDTAGNFDTCSFVVLVSDTSKPFVNGCPADITVLYDPGAGGGVATWTPPTFVDNCSSSLIVSSNYNPGDTLSCGNNKVIYTAKDSSGNAIECAFTVFVKDTLPPVILKCPKDTTFTTSLGSCKAIVNWDTLVVGDNCSDSILLSSNIRPLDSLAVGTYTVNYTATDTSGNSSSCSFKITVKESVAPVITCPFNVTVTQDGRILKDSSGIVLTTRQNSDCKNVEITFKAPTASDNCKLDTLFQVRGIANGGNYPIGTDTITYRAVDASGNSSECSFTVTVVPIEKPKVSISSNLVCEGQMAQLFADSIKGANATYNWFGPNNFTSIQQNPKINNVDITRGGLYYAQVIINGCRSANSDSIRLDVLVKPSLADDVDTVLNDTTRTVWVTRNDAFAPGQNIVLRIAQGGTPKNGRVVILSDSTIQYIPDSFFIGIDQFVYEICYEDCPNLCATATVTMIVKNSVPGCPVPTVLTPNDDGYNDYLIVDCLTGKENSEIYIFNQWGDQIFHSAPYFNNWWDGNYKGQPVPDGTYYYLFWEDRSDPTKKPKKGFITVFR